MITVHQAQQTYLESQAAIKEAEKSLVELQIFINNGKVQLEGLADMFNKHLKEANK